MNQVQQNTFEKRSATAKNNAAIAAIAILLAKNANDPLAKRALGFKRRFLQLKMQIVKKYMAQARARYYNGQSQANSTPTK